MPVPTPDTYRRACGQFATGVCVVTAFDGAPHGCTVNSFTSVSLHPPLVLFCLDREANVAAAFRSALHFAVNVLAADQREVSSAFAFKQEGRFEGIGWRPGLEGIPLLDGAVAHLECRLVRVLPAGDHDILIGEVLQLECFSGEPLVYWSGGYAQISR